MQTKTKYDEMILKEIRGIPAQSLPQVVKILHSLKESIIAVGVAPKKEIKKSGLCGIWVDDRSAEEIIEDMHAHRYVRGMAGANRAF